MESIYIGLEAFKELDHCQEQYKQALKQYHEDLSLDISMASLEHIKHDVLFELKRRARDDEDSRTKELLEQVEQEGIIKTLS